MSLKAFHLVFVGLCLLLCLGLGTWSLVRYASGAAGLFELAFGLMWLAAGVAMGFYGRMILRKLKHISYL
jgi:hypothetical protein